MSDSIEVSVTHEIKIAGDKSWVGTSYTTSVGDNETADEAHERANALVQRAVMTAIQSTVDTVQEYTA